jgi:hypothetical protein
MHVEELFQAASTGNLSSLMSERAAELTPQLADQARRRALQAISAGDLDLAEVATGTAASVWLQLGNYQLAITNLIDMQQVGYMRADQPEQYAQVRTQLLDSVDKAMQVGSRLAAFRAATIAADCSYWSALADGPDSQDLTLQAVRDVIAAADLLPADLHALGVTADGQRFVALAAAAARRAMAIYFRPQASADEADKLLRQLAAAVARIVPADFALEQLDEKGRPGQTALAFASLADQYGG